MSSRPSLLTLTAISARIGNLTFGGGDPAMLALQREVVEIRRWLEPERFTLIWSLARVTPGTNVLACFAGAGWQLAGPKGAIAAVVGSSLPAAVLCYWLTLAEREWQGNPWVAAALRGVTAAVVGMMLAGAMLLLRPSWRTGGRPGIVLTAIAAAVASHFGGPPILILALAAGAGWLLAKEA